MNATIDLMERYAARRRVALTTLGRYIVGNSTVAERLAEGRVTVGTVRRIEQWLSDRWPDDLPWPAEVERPAPHRDDREEDAA